MDCGSFCAKKKKKKNLFQWSPVIGHFLRKNVCLKCQRDGHLTQKAAAAAVL